jgi:hypothetical protein
MLASILHACTAADYPEGTPMEDALSFLLKAQPFIDCTDIEFRTSPAIWIFRTKLTPYFATRGSFSPE